MKNELKGNLLNTKRGFTLVELLTVLVIIGIILGITIPNVAKLMHNQNDKKLNVLIDAALKASNVYIEEYKGGFIDTHDKYNFQYESLISKNYVKEEDINCSGTIQATRKKGNNYTYKAYLTCKDKNGNVISDNLNELPPGGISIMGKFIMDYSVKYNNASGSKYDFNYTSNNLYNEFTAYDLERIGTSAGISKFAYSYDNKNWIELSANEVTGVGSFILSTTYVGKIYFKAYDMYGNESEVQSYNVKIDKIAPTGTLAVARNGGSYNSLNIKATLNAKDNTNGSGVKQMCVQESNNVNNCNWITYTTSRNLTLSGTLDGRPRTIYAWFKDGVGNIAAATNASGGTGGSTYIPYHEGSEVVMSEWSSCSKVCGGGTQTKTAKDKYTGKVIPEKGQSQSCNTMDCCSKTIRTGNSNWSTCSKTCGGGTQTRDVYYKSYYNGQTCPTAVKAESQACNTQSCDVTAPSFSITKATSWVKSDTVRVTITDNETGVVAYQWTTSNSQPSSWTNITNTKSTTISRNFTSNQTVYIWAKDAVGNIGHTAVVENRIDTTAPTISSVTGNPTSWTNKNVTLTVNASDSESGLHATAYSFDNGATWQAGKTKTYSSNTNNIIIKVRDALGNTRTHSTINITRIDKSRPNITSVSKSTNNWTKQNVTLTIIANDSGSGLHSTPYSFDNGATWQTGRTKTYSSNTNNIIVKVRDATGNISTASTVNITNIDKTAPTQAFSIESSSGSGGWFRSLTLKVTLSDVGSGVKSAKYCITNLPQCTPNQTASISNNAFSVPLNSVYSAYKVCVQTTDNVDQTSTLSCSSTYNVDTVDPIARVSATVSGTYVVVRDDGSSDQGSGIAKREYKLDNGSWYNATTSYSFANVSGGNHTVYLRVTDKSGRTATASTTVSVSTSYVLLNGKNSEVEWDRYDNMRCSCKMGGFVSGSKGDSYRYCRQSGNFTAGMKTSGLHISADSAGEYSDGDVYSVSGVAYSNTTIDFSQYKTMKISCDGPYWVGSKKNYLGQQLRIKITNDPRETCPLWQDAGYSLYSKSYTIWCGTDVAIDISDVTGSYYLAFSETGDRKSGPVQIDITSIKLES